MMKAESKDLIKDLMERTRQNLSETEALQLKTMEVLNWKKNEKSWNVLECLEHLCLYGDFYLPEIESSIKNAKFKTEPVFKSGSFGNYFANLMLPRENLKKFKSLKNKVSLNKTKIGTSISQLIKLKLGDAFRVVIYHNQRHLVQARKILEEKEKPEMAL